MADQNGDDPFHWKVDRLIQELCTPNRSWTAPAAHKLPDPVKLEQKLREHELDGEDLLTYENVFGPGSTEQLFKDLEIVKIPHKTSIQKAIRTFQTRSPSYLRWKQANLQNGDTATAPQGLQELVAQHDSKRGAGLISSDTQVSNAPKGAQLPETLSVPAQNGVVDAGVAGPVEESPKKKRKRVVPTLIPKSPPTPGAYLGADKLPNFFVMQTPNAGEIDPETTHSVTREAKPPGIRIHMAKQMRRFLQPRTASMGSGHIGRHPPILERNTKSPDRDEILPAFGDSEDEYDSDTWAEIEAEEAERKELEAQRLRDGKKQYIDKVSVDAAIQKAIESLENSWKTEKLPKQRERANRLWHTGRKKVVRQQIMLGVRKSAKELQARMDKACDTMRDLDWTTEEELVKVATGSLERTVYDKMDCSWTIHVLNSPSEPKKIKSRQVRQIPKAKKPASDSGDDLSSSDSDSNFVVNDEEGDDASLASDSMDVDHSLANVHGFELEAASSAESSDEGVQCFDLTQISDSSDEEDRPLRSVQNNTVDEALFKTPKKASSITAPDSEATMPDTDANEGEFPFNDPQAIADMGPQHWKRMGDNRRLAIAILCGTDDKVLSRLFDYLHNLGPDALWRKFCWRAIERRSLSLELGPGTPNALLEDIAFNFNRLLHAFIDCAIPPSGEWRPMSDELVERLKSHRSRIPSFRNFMCSIVPFFPKSQPTDFTPRNPSAVPGEDEGSSSKSNSDSDVGRSSPSKRRQRRRQVRQDKAALKLRKDDLLRIKEQEERRNALRARLARSDYSSISRDASRLIINESKQDHQGEIYVNKTIGERIKDHQIEGVRFMWNQIIDTDNRQGCLLAHTMGLGKTMQVITLLVAISEAALSEEQSVLSQIPPELRDSKTLVLCPSGLVNNWHDELLQWTPEGLLGQFRSVDAQVPDDERPGLVSDWALDGGVLIVGYDLFRNLVKDDGIASLLKESPNIVVADEAHVLKNPASAIAKATADFRTKVRIALTGSPLANSVEEYHSMIDWLAPNYLGPHKEFASMYANPIKEGLYADSSPSEKRKARQMLKVLKDTVAPKVHRVTMAALKSELPVKQEFILFLPITDFQRKAYQGFLDLVTPSGGMVDQEISQIGLFHLVFNLTLLLAHPKVFQAKLQSSKKSLEGPKEAKRQKAKKAGKEKEPNLTLGMIGNLLQLIRTLDIENIKYSAKVIVLLKILDEAKRVGDKTLVFSQSKDTLDYLEEMFRRQKRLFARLDGATRVDLRQNLIKNFNAGADDVYLISTTAGGVGLNITGANRVVIFDFKWNPTQEQQAIGRSFRIGQTKPVYVYWLIVGGTHEAVLHNQQVFKTQLAARVVDKKNPAAWSQTKRDYTAAPTLIETDRASLANARGRDGVLDSLLDHDSQQCLRRIVLTDTFEEEELDDKLTPEELQHATEMIRLNRLRIMDPEEWEKQTQLMHQSHAPTQVPVQASIPISLPFPSLLSHVYRPNGQVPVSRARVGQHSVQAQNIPSHGQGIHPFPPTQSLQIGQAHFRADDQRNLDHQPPVQQPNGHGPSHGSFRDINSRVPISVDGQPVHFRRPLTSSETPLPATPSSHERGGASTGLESVAKPPSGNVGTVDGFRAQLKIQLGVMEKELTQLHTSIDVLEQETVAALATALGTDIPSMPKWALLTRCIAQSQRFVKAFLYKHFRPDELAMLSETEAALLDRLRVLEELPGPGFEETISPHKRPHLTASLSIPPEQDSADGISSKQTQQPTRPQVNGRAQGEGQGSCKSESHSASSQAESKQKRKGLNWKRKSLLPRQTDNGQSAQDSPKQGEAADLPIVID